MTLARDDERCACYGIAFLDFRKSEHASGKGIKHWRGFGTHMGRIVEGKSKQPQRIFHKAC